MFAEVIVDVLSSNVDKIFDYIIGEDLDAKTGCRVSVPFGGRNIDGYIINIKQTSTVDESKLKKITKLLDLEPVITQEQIALMHYMEQQFFLRKVDILRLFLPPSVRNGTAKELIEKNCKLVDKQALILHLQNVKKNASKKILLDKFLLENEGVLKISYLNSEFGSANVLSLITENILEVFETKINRKPKFIEEELEKFKLTAEQQAAISQIEGYNKETILIHGVTGSGKTEIYLNLISKQLALHKTSIMLVPEISLTPQIFSKFQSRFGDLVAIIHSGLSNGERFDEWQRILNGEAKVIVGARSALFVPVSNIGLIIMDEEHDSSYFSESNPRYSAQEVAKFRANYNNCNLILGSATPLVETYYKSQTDEYKICELKNRVNNIKMPEISIVDMTSEIKNGNNSFFSSLLLKQLDETIANKKQAMIFINRRGYSSFLRCIDCGYVPTCDECDVSLVYHKEDEQLKCHFCGKRFKVINKCPVCGSERIRQGGVGTERVVLELKKLYPNVKILRMDNDTTQTKDAVVNILNEFKNTNPAILVGTQMIAKGHDFPNVNFVGIIDADLSLYLADYRSVERTFELISQVSGRAGRNMGDGKVVLQTYTPRHYVYKFAKDNNYTDFYNREINLRETTNFPPFTTICRILISTEIEELSKNIALKLLNNVKQVKELYKDDFIFLDAMKSPIKKIQNKFRYQILMRFKNKYKYDILNRIQAILDNNRIKNANLFLEINPQNLS